MTRRDTLLRGSRDPWRLAEPSDPRADERLARWLAAQPAPAPLAPVRDPIGPLHAAAFAAARARDEAAFERVRAEAERLMLLFETRKSPCAFDPRPDAPVDLRACALLRAVWVLVARATGDHRFLNSALKLAEWTRETARRRGGLPAVWPGEEPSAEATRLHLRAAEAERRAVEELERGDG